MGARLAARASLGPGLLGYLVAVVLVVVCFTAVDVHLGSSAEASSSSVSVAMTATERSFVSALQQVRTRYGLPALAPDGRLAAAARGHSQAIVASGAFVHGQFWKRIEAHGITSGSVAENLGWTSSSSGAAARVVAAWLASPDHRRILLDPDYRQIGVGVDVGAFKGYPDALVVTTDFHGA
jgi:uncharacterized protein YkwD